MTKPIILLDCDGPLSNFTKGYLDALFVETGARHTPEEVDRWAIHDCDFFKQAARKLNITEAKLRDQIAWHVSKEGFCESLEVQPGAVEAVEKLKSLGDVYVVTSPWDSSRTWMFERLHWIADEFGLPRARVIQTGTKHLIRGDVFVDDKPSHVADWARAWPNGAAMLFDMHHNRAESGVPLRRASWTDVLAHVGAIALGDAIVGQTFTGVAK